MEGAEILLIADNLKSMASEFEEKYKPLLRQAAEETIPYQRSWSGSNIGYHSCVYYSGLKSPPPGAHFSKEWGLMDTFSEGSRGDWQEFQYDHIYNYLSQSISILPEIEDAASELQCKVSDAISELKSALLLINAERSDSYLDTLLNSIDKLKFYTAQDFAIFQIPNGQHITRDATALGQGLRAAPHQAFSARLTAITQAPEAAKELEKLARRAGSHLVRREKIMKKSDLTGTNVFIGHGRSHEWRLLKDFIKDRMHLPYDEFNRVPVAGFTNIARLSEMLDAASIAFLVLTAEDEQLDGKTHARMNVIHEVGLFQGRLGFSKAIVLLEQDCEEFTNIQGLGQIRFPKGNISAAFEEVRLVLERENLVGNS
jgi:predicted nucleotide-binding protein